MPIDITSMLNALECAKKHIIKDKTTEVQTESHREQEEVDRVKDTMRRVLIINTP